jgi:hypothetical protein
MSEELTKVLPDGDLKLILQETRPIWEQVLTKLGNLEDEMRNGFRKVERQVGLLAEDVLIVRADQRDLEKRVNKIEQEPTQ